MLANLNGVSGSVVVSAINSGSNVTISADRINIQGVIQRLTHFDIIDVKTISVTNHLSLYGSGVSWKSATIAGTTIRYLG